MEETAIISISVVLYQSVIRLPLSLVLTLAAQFSPLVVLSFASVNTAMFPELQASPIKDNWVILFFIHSTSQVVMSESSSLGTKLAVKSCEVWLREGSELLIARLLSVGGVFWMVISVVLDQSLAELSTSTTLTDAVQVSHLVVLSLARVKVAIFPRVQASPIKDNWVILFFIHSTSQVIVSESTSAGTRLTMRF